jgi:hypothetical protein
VLVAEAARERAVDKVVAPGLEAVVEPAVRQARQRVALAPRALVARADLLAALAQAVAPLSRAAVRLAAVAARRALGVRAVLDGAAVDAAELGGRRVLAQPPAVGPAAAVLGAEVGGWDGKVRRGEVDVKGDEPGAILTFPAG